MTVTKDVVRARALAVQAEKVKLLEVIKDYAISSDEEFADAAELLKVVKKEFKNLDTERSSYVKPYNDEVKEINDWFRPALEYLREMERRLKSMIGDYDAKKRAEQQRLLEEIAASAASAASSSSPEGEGSVVSLADVKKAAPPVVKGISTKAVWTFTVEDESQVPREFCSPDLRKIQAALEAGVRDIPGVRIEQTTQVVARAATGRSK